MGLINKKERIVDLCLTQKGRELLSKGQLSFSYYAFSDEGVDYSGSLASVSVASSSLDNYVHRNLAFESLQKAGSFDFLPCEKLKNIIYTVPAGSRNLPDYVTTVSAGSAITLERKYIEDDIYFQAIIQNSTFKPIACITRAEIETNSELKRIQDYVKSQLVDAVNEKKVYSSIGKKVEFVVGLDTKDIDLSIKYDLKDDVDLAKAGFLVEIFNSGSDGVLTKITQNGIKNNLSQEVEVDGFSDFLNLTVK